MSLAFFSGRQRGPGGIRILLAIFADADSTMRVPENAVRVEKRVGVFGDASRDSLQPLGALRRSGDVQDVARPENLFVDEGLACGAFTPFDGRKLFTQFAQVVRHLRITMVSPNSFGSPIGPANLEAAPVRMLGVAFVLREETYFGTLGRVSNLRVGK